MALAVGSLLAGRYEITAPVAVGGMGEVWRARDRVLDRVVAAKVLRSEYTGDPNFLARFRNEARHTAALSHPNIASVYDYGETYDDAGGQALAFLVMEFVEGQPLVTILHDEGALPVDWTLHVLGQAADGLSAAHRAGVVHRDIKPGNLMVRPDGVVKLTDFGIAQARDATPLTRTGMVVGTAQYLSPEQAQGFPVTAASDVYSLGVLGYECLTGARPFDGASQVAIALAHINRPPPPLPRDIPPGVRALIERALAKDAADRFPDGGAFAEAIRQVAAGGSPTGGPGGGLLGGAAAGAAAAGLAGTNGLVRPTGTTQMVGDPDARTRVFGSTTAAGAAAGAGAAGAAAGPQTTPRPMPPLQGPPVDEGSTGEDWGDERPSRRRWAWIAAAVVLLLLLAGGTWFLLAGGDGGGPAARSSTSTSSSASSAGTVFIDTSAYVGRPSGEVGDELRAQGLTVEVRDATNDQLAAAGRDFARGDVVTTDPAEQAVAQGSTVTLFAAPRDYRARGASSAAPTTSQAPQTSAEPTTSAPTSVLPSLPTTSLPVTSESTAPGSSAPPPSTPASDTVAAGTGPTS